MHPNNYQPEIIGIEAPLISNPGRTRADMNTVATELGILKNEILNSSVDNDMKIYTQAIVEEWNNFYDITYDSWWETGKGSTWQKINEWKERIMELRNKFIAKGGSTTTSKKALEQPSTPFTISKPGIWGWFLLGGVGIWLLIELMGQRTEAIRAKTGFLRTVGGQSKSHKKGQY